MLIRPGDYLFPGAPIAVARAWKGGVGDPEEIGQAIRSATSFSSERTSSADLEYTIRQLVEVGVRALSSGINDPNTAVSVLDRLGAALCDLAGRHLPTGIWTHDGRTCLLVPSVDYDGLADAMFHTIRQDAAGSTTVVIRLLDVLTAVAVCEPRGERRAALGRHAKLVVEDARREIPNPSDLQDVLRRFDRFEAACAGHALRQGASAAT